jgi:hypothetical protein
MRTGRHSSALGGSLQELGFLRIQETLALEI